jgi:hypothetical protein
MHAAYRQSPCAAARGCSGVSSGAHGIFMDGGDPPAMSRSLPVRMFLDDGHPEAQDYDSSYVGVAVGPEPIGQSPIEPGDAPRVPAWWRALVSAWCA